MSRLTEADRAELRVAQVRTSPVTARIEAAVEKILERHGVSGQEAGEL